MSFTGFPERALDFYEGLLADNTKAYWTDHKDVYDTGVKAPLTALLDELEPEFGAAKVFRPYRDVRFSKDKTPYKTQAAAAVHGEGGALYVAFGADGLFVAGGYWQTTTDQARRLRAAAADDVTGTALVAVLDGVAAAGLSVDGERLKRVPAEHAEAARPDLVTLKSLTASVQHEPGPWLHTPEALDRVRDAWRAVRPLNAWLDEHVGPPRDPVQR